MLTKALKAFRRKEGFAEDGLGWLSFACQLSRDLWDDQGWATLSIQLVDRARRTGALTVLPLALTEAVAVRLLGGEPTAAAELAQEAEFVTRATGNPVRPYGPLLLAAWEGREAETRRLISNATAHMVARGEGRWLTAAAWATAVLHNGRGCYHEALAAAEQGSENPAELGLASWSLVELIEAAVRSGLPERAAGALQRLSEAARRRRHRLGARGRGPLTGAAERRRARRAAVPRGDRPSRPHPDPRRAGPRAPALRGVAAPPRPARRCARAAPGSPRDADRDGGRGVRRARPPRAGGHRRDRAPTHDRIQPTSSPRRRRRSPGSPVPGIPTRRSAPSCSSARARSSGTCGRCSPSSASAPGTRSATPCPTWKGRASGPSGHPLVPSLWVMTPTRSGSPTTRAREGRTVRPTGRASPAAPTDRRSRSARGRPCRRGTP